MKTLQLSIILTGLAAFSPLAISQTSPVKSLTWTVRKSQWSTTDEKNYQEFIKGIGRAREKRLCTNTDNCLKSKDANPMYYGRNPKDLSVFSDCADLPFVLRGYFAWMNDLPFSYPSEVIKADPSDTSSDIRYSSRGNKIYKRTSVKDGDSVKRVLQNVSDSISSAMFRIPPQRDVEANGSYSDFYSPKISRDSIIPGTVVYDPNGHVLVVYEVSDDGRIFMIDAHPDNSLSRSVYGEKFVRSNPNAGAGFKNWRPLINENGAIRALKNSEINDFNLDQYYGNDGSVDKGLSWSKGQFLINNNPSPYYDYVRLTLSKGNLHFNPIVELTEMLKSLCDDFKDRKVAVDESFKHGINTKAHPDSLPNNIYGTSGEWESFSSPSRDARFKAAIREARSKVNEFVSKYYQNDPSIDYKGQDLIADLTNVYNKETSSCSISYNNSKGTPVTLNLDQGIDRAYTISFDPYHCIELRWGATGSELLTCTDNQNKRAWYAAEQVLRNSIDRNYDILMNKNLTDLPNSGLGKAVAEDISIKSLLNSLKK